VSISDSPCSGGLTNFSREMKKCESLVLSIATESALKKGASQQQHSKQPGGEVISLAIVGQLLRPCLPATVL